MSSESSEAVTFQNLNLNAEVQRAVEERGYSAPTPIQAQIIPHLLSGRDVLGQADTGTGKTAAFALPLLSMVDRDSRVTQVLVLTPTRELAIQVADSFKSYGINLTGVNVQAIYGGASYSEQLRGLKRGAQVVVGTPGRVMDHIRRGTLDLSTLRCVVLDEADEMLRMGFVEDVTWILEHTPPQRQFALFSATMPDPIRRIADTHLKDPAVISVQQRNRNEASIRARYLITPWRERTAALYRVLETEETDAVIVFTKTRETTLRVAEDLQARGYAAVAINGDIPQRQREVTIEQLRSGKINILVATDVAARGLDVARISHVINYDLPTDNQIWVHRIGRTGRAGRSGEAILFISWKERRFLKGLERESRQTISEMKLPTNADVNQKRVEQFEAAVTKALANVEASEFWPIIRKLQQTTNASPEHLAAAIAVAMHGEQPFLLANEPKRRQETSRPPREDRPQRERRGDRDASTTRRAPQSDHHGQPPRERRDSRFAEPGMERFRIEVGHDHGVKPGNIVGAIANEAGLDASNIGRIDIQSDHSFVDLPEGMPKPIFRGLKDVVVLGRHLRITRTVPAGRQNKRFQRRGRSDHSSRNNRGPSGRSPSGRAEHRRPPTAPGRPA